MAKANTKAERKPAKSANSEQRFTIHELEQARRDAYSSGWAAGNRAGTVRGAASMASFVAGGDAEQAGVHAIGWAQMEIATNDTAPF